MRGILVAAATLAALSASTPQASATVGLEPFDVRFVDENGQAALEAGSHPFAMVVDFEVTTKEAEGGVVPDEPLKDFFGTQIPGLVADPKAVEPCSTVDFLTHPPLGTIGRPFLPTCADGSAVGYVVATIGQPEGKLVIQTPVYNLEPSPGTVAKIGFWAEGVPITVDIGLTDSHPYRGIATARNVTQILEFFAAEFVFWGNPADPDHDENRAACALPFIEGSCPAEAPERPFLTLPRACEGPLASGWTVDSWERPGVWVSGEALTRGDDGKERGIGGCGELGFAPRVSAEPTNHAAEGPSGLDVELAIDDEGLTNAKGRADSDIKRVVATLPEGMTLNPSAAAGLAACSEAQLEAESVGSAPDEGCPPASKVGTIEVQTPLLDGHTLRGAVFVATPYENPFGTLIAIYMTIKEPELGIDVKLAGKVEPDPRSGQLIATFGAPDATDAAFRTLPQLPVSRFRMHFREGGRSPLVTPPLCGAHRARFEFTPWANPSETYVETAEFEIVQGPGGGPCPSAGQPFVPGFAAGSIGNRAGSYSPFFLRFLRRDGDQDLTRFDATMPKGLVARLAGVQECPEAAIAAAKLRRGADELASPSCPAGSRIGSVQAGAGVGSQLTYVNGRVYLAGPVGGAPLSVVGIVPAVAGPFDVGTIVVRQALRVDSRSVEVTVDGAASDPIPHILAGIPLRVRDIQAHVDRHQFTLNPTNCAPGRVAARLWGGGNDPFSTADDAPLSLEAPFQVTDCAALGFKPRLAIRLKGGTRRGAHPALRAVVTPRPGDANFKKAVVTLPRSAFLDQAHIRTICTRVQFAADACPKGAVYGFARAFSPLLSEPLQGPVYLRSSDHNLPDLVADLHGRIDVEVVGRIDSNRGGIRSSFELLPDAPVSRFVLRMRGGKRGLIVNSRDLCARKSRAIARFSGQNGRRRNFRPIVRATRCRAKHRVKRGGHRRSEKRAISRQRP
jgi:hypothetical protein